MANIPRKSLSGLPPSKIFSQYQYYWRQNGRRALSRGTAVPRSSSLWAVFNKNKILRFPSLTEQAPATIRITGQLRISRCSSSSRGASSVSRGWEINVWLMVSVTSSHEHPFEPRLHLTHWPAMYHSCLVYHCRECRDHQQSLYSPQHGRVSPALLPGVMHELFMKFYSSVEP